MKGLKKWFRISLVWAMVLGIIGTSPSTYAVESNQASVSIYPQPQSLTVDSDEGMKLKGNVDIVIHGDIGKATLPKLEELLKNEGLTYELKDSIGSNAAIVIGVACENEECEICQMFAENEALKKDQGYVLKSSNDILENGLITIVGKDQDGAYYGVMSLLQMFKQKTSDGRIGEVTISDYPDVLFRGYVEGFYGVPWSFEDRADLFRTTSLYKMTTYIYAPKDDPYHRGSWRSLYPADKAKEIQDLAAIASENNMEFCWSIHPGADYNYANDDDYNQLLAKLEQVYSLGVRQFGIFYDDLDYGVADGLKHAEVINRAYDDLMGKYGDIKPFITVLTRYTNSWGASMETYFKPFMQNIYEDTIVLWTGNSTMSAITKDYYEWPQTQTGIDRDLGVWWNYPVNDYCRGHLLMGRLDCLDNDVDNIASFFLNPMSESDASKVAIYSGADYSWNISDFDSDRSWKRAIKELVPEANDAFERFADNISYLDQGNGFFFDESVYLKDDLADFENALANGNIADKIPKMIDLFTQIRDDAKALKNINNKELLEEILPHLNAYEYLGEAGIAAMEGIQDALEGKIEESLEKIGALEKALMDCRDCKIVLNGNNQAFVGSNRIVPFLNNMSQKIMTILNNNIKDNKVDKMLTNMDIDTKEVQYNKGIYSLKDINALMKKGDYITIALSKVMNIYEVSVQGTPLKNLKIQYSLNGIEWKELKTNDIVMGAYVRVVATNDDTTVNSIDITQAKEKSFVRVETNMATYQDYTYDKAIDGNFDTLFWSSEGSRDGSYIGLDLGSPAELGKITLYSSTNKLNTIDAFEGTQLEVSVDGFSWKKVGDVKPIADFEVHEGTIRKLQFDGEGEIGRYFRLVAVGTSSSWLKVHEIEYEAEYVDGADHAVVSTNMKTYQDYDISNAMDNKMDTKYYSSQTTSAGDYIQVDLGVKTAIYDATLYFGGDTHKSAIDGFREMKLQVSLDGETWQDASEPILESSYEVNDEKYIATVNGNGVQARYIRFTATKAGDSWVQVFEIKYNQSVRSIDSGKVSTNMKTYQDYNISNAMDNKMDTKYYSSQTTSVGDYIQVDLGVKTAIYDATLYFGGDTNKSAIDGFREMKLQVSQDGETWQDASEPIPESTFIASDGKYIATINGNGVQARYIRFTATKAGDSWVQVFEIKLNKTIDTNNLKYVEGSVNIGQSQYLDDKRLNTSPAIYDVKENDTLVYLTNTITSIGKLGIYQDASTITHAKVSVQLLDGTWKDIGSLDEIWNQFNVDQVVLAIKLTFDGTVSDPIIYEFILNEKELKADYSAISIAIDMADKVTQEQLDKVVPVVANEFKAALTNAKTVYAKENACQEEVDNAFNRLAKVMQMLEFYKGDKAALQKMMDQIANLSANDYTDSTWKALQAVLPGVNEVLGNANAMQKEVDEVYTELVKAFVNLRLKPNKDLLADLINKANELNRANYTAASLKLVDEETAKANKVLNDPEATAEEVENAVNGLTKAMVGLVENNPVVDNNVDTPDTVKPGDTTVKATKTGDNSAIEATVALMTLGLAGYYISKKRKY